jgi:hypothetical protein
VALKAPFPLLSNKTDGHLCGRSGEHALPSYRRSLHALANALCHSGRIWCFRRRLSRRIAAGTRHVRALRNADCDRPFFDRMRSACPRTLVWPANAYVPAFREAPSTRAATRSPRASVCSYAGTALNSRCYEKEPARPSTAKDGRRARLSSPAQSVRSVQ